MPFDFSDILVSLAPRAVFINAPLRDENFEVSGVKDCVEAALPVYDKVFHAKKKMKALYPSSAHEFPVRRAARVLDRSFQGAALQASQEGCSRWMVRRRYDAPKTQERSWRLFFFQRGNSKKRLANASL